MRKLYFVIMLFSIHLHSQIGIGTIKVDDSAILQLESKTSAFVIPRMTNAQMQNIISPLNGDLIFNNSEDIPYLKISEGWKSFESSTSPSVSLRVTSGTFPTSPTQDYFMKLNSTNVESISTTYFEIVSDGSVKILKDGIYLINATLSTTGLPSGDRNINFYVNLNGTLIGTLFKTRFNFPVTDYWGTSGSLMYKARANDVFSVKYFINTATNTSLNTAFQALSIIKIN